MGWLRGAALQSSKPKNISRIELPPTPKESLQKSDWTDLLSLNPGLLLNSGGIERRSLFSKHFPPVHFSGIFPFSPPPPLKTPKGLLRLFSTFPRENFVAANEASIPPHIPREGRGKGLNFLFLRGSSQVRALYGSDQREGAWHK